MKRVLLLVALPVSVAACVAALPGCQLGLFGAKPDRTTYRTPALRVEEAHALAAQASGENTPEQQEMVNELGRRIQHEGDPLVREALMDAIARFPMPLADQVLTAGLTDPDPGVRQHCCSALGARGMAAAVPELARVAASDDEFDVRVAATHALGDIKSPAAVKALVASLEDSNPAMQYAGVEAMRSATGQDLGGDVRAYVALAKGETPQVATKPASPAAGFLESLSPF